MIRSEEEREQRLKLNAQSLRNLWENTKLSSIQLIRIPEEKEGKRYMKKKVTTCPNLVKHTNLQIQKAQVAPKHRKSR